MDNKSNAYTVGSAIEEALMYRIKIEKLVTALNTTSVLEPLNNDDICDFMHRLSLAFSKLSRTTGII